MTDEKYYLKQKFITMPNYLINNNKIIYKIIIPAVIILFQIIPQTGHTAGYPGRDAVVQAIETVSPAVVNISSEYEISRTVEI